MRRVLKRLDTMWTALTRITILIVIVAVGWVAYHDIAGDTVSLEAISVPKALAKKGLTPEVVATDIRGNLVKFVNQSNTTMHHTNVMMNGSVASTAPDIVVPGTGFSVGSMTSWINARLLSSGLRSRLHLPERRVVTGEIVQSDKGYTLCLRLNDEMIYQTDSPVAGDSINQEIETASVAVAKRTMPYMYASYLYSIHLNSVGTDDAGKLATLRSVLHGIIDKLPYNDENVVYSFNLLGLVLTDSNDDEGAKADFNLANTLAERAGIEHFELAYINLAYATLQSARAADDAANEAANPKLADVQRAMTLELVARARRYANTAIARAPSAIQTYYPLSEIELFQAHLAAESGDKAEFDASVLTTKRVYDAEIALAPDEPFAYWDRADLQAANTGVHDIIQAVADRYQGLDLLRKSQRHIPISSGDYLTLENDLVSESNEVAAGRLDNTREQDTSERDLIATLATSDAATAGAILPRQVAEPPADPAVIADWRLRRRRALLIEACEAVCDAARLVPSGADGDGTRRLVATTSRNLDDAGAEVGETIPACEATPPK